MFPIDDLPEISDERLWQRLKITWSSYNYAWSHGYASRAGRLKDYLEVYLYKEVHERFKFLTVEDFYV